MLRNETTDEVLLTQYKEGSSEALNMLYRRHSAKILGYLKSKVKGEQLALDIMQETFLKIHRSKHLYNEKLPALPWIFTITYSVMMDSLRKIGRSKEVFNHDLSAIAAEEKRADSSAEILETDIKALSENQRTALELRFHSEKSFEDIAQILETSPGNVRKLVSRAIGQIRKLSKGGPND